MLGVPASDVAGRAFAGGCGMKISKQQFAALVTDAPRLTVPHSTLTLSSTYQGYQVRPSTDAPQMELAKLAASIKAVGLLQNLMVVACAKD